MLAGGDRLGPHLATMETALVRGGEVVGRCRAMSVCRSD